MIDLSEVSTSDRQKRVLIGIPFFLLVTLALPIFVLLGPCSDAKSNDGGRLNTRILR